MSKPHDFFVSYASEDRAAAAVPIVDELKRRGFEVWFDQDFITSQDAFDEKIRAGLRDCHYGVVIVSPQFLHKDWPTRELDILLMTEAIDGRRRLLIVVHGMTVDDLITSSPHLAALKPVDMSLGATDVCDKLLARIYALAAERKDLLSQEQREGPFPHIRAIGILTCENPSCGWRVSDEILRMIGRDPGPEFVFRLIQAEWFAVCVSCGTPAYGPLRSDDVKDLAGLARMISAASE